MAICIAYLFMIKTLTTCKTCRKLLIFREKEYNNKLAKTFSYLFHYFVFPFLITCCRILRDY